MMRAFGYLLILPNNPGVLGDGRGWDRTSDLPRVKRALSR
jgi:hypothetical protein